MKNKFILLILILFIALPTAAFFLLFEPYYETQKLGWSPTAYQNRYLAAEKYLARAGIEATTSNSLINANPLSEIDTIFISDARNVLTKQQTEELWQWISNGGHLILSGPPTDWEAGSSALLERLGIEIYSTDCDCDRTNYFFDDEASGENDDDTEEPVKSKDHGNLKELLDTPEKSDDSHHPIDEISGSDTTDNNNNRTDKAPIEESTDPSLITELEFDEVDGVLHINFNPATALYHPYMDDEEDTESDSQPFYWQGSEWGTHFMQFYIGEGMVSVVSDPAIWQNYYLEEFDHAYLLSILTDYSKTVRFIVGSNMPSLAALIWQNAPEFVIACGLLLITWLYYRSRRFLPATGINYTVRRSLAEHIQAVGDYLWQQKQSNALLASIRQEIEQRAGFYIGGFNQLSQAQQYQKLAELAQLPMERVASAMAQTDIISELVFTETIQSLQTIKAKL
ncbi:DUF4350 domain-containing protein [Halioxenophilus sp. WMMB6]|uniref:DUF4350 domain-containing protein n=1 Tax=Halioxenophilus sp. WMMB6 TaxID=3073815 RepID=UPI00295EDDEC|nr:DUF4350 domain-containing protein [Halioxenophilus sp. WMMB6]